MCIKRTPIHQTFTSTATWPLDNMPKIHPETKVLIIKRLKTRSTAEVADTFNVSQRQVQRIRKRYEETGDVFDKPRSDIPRKTTAREDRLLARKSKASPFSTAAELHETWSPEVLVSTRTVCRILSRNGLHGRISSQKPALNKRQLKNCVAFAKAHSLPKGKVAEGGFLRWIFCWITSQSLQILQETYWSPHGSEIHLENSQVWWRKNHGLGLHPVWGCVRDLQGGRQHQLSKISRSLSCPLTFPTIKGAKLCSRMVLHRILPSLHQSSSRWRRSRCSRIGQPSHQTWTSLSMSGVGWKRKHGRRNQRILMNSGRHARLLSLLFLMTSSINCMNPCRTAWMQSFKLMEVIQDIKFGTAPLLNSLMLCNIFLYLK